MTSGLLLSCVGGCKSPLDCFCCVKCPPMRGALKVGVATIGVTVVLPPSMGSPWLGGEARELGGRSLPCAWLTAGNRTYPACSLCLWLLRRRGRRRPMSTCPGQTQRRRGGAPASASAPAPALRRPLWGVVTAGGWEVGAVGARSIAKTITIVSASRRVSSGKAVAAGLRYDLFCSRSESVGE